MLWKSDNGCVYTNENHMKGQKDDVVIPLAKSAHVKRLFSIL